MKFVDSENFISALSVILRNAGEECNLFEKIRPALRHYLASEWMMTLDSYRRTAVTKLLLTIFEQNVDNSASYEDCRDVSEVRLAHLTHHYRSDKVSTKTNDECYIDEEGFKAAATDLWNGSDCTYYPGTIEVTQFVFIQ